jgi:hypothetical protein
MATQSLLPQGAQSFSQRAQKIAFFTFPLRPLRLIILYRKGRKVFRKERKENSALCAYFVYFVVKYLRFEYRNNKELEQWQSPNSL